MISSLNRASSRQFLFAVMALDRGLISRDAAVAAFHAWSFDKSVPLASRLVNQGAVSASVALEFEAVIDRHLSEHGGEIGLCLTAVGQHVRHALAEALAANPDGEIRLFVELLTSGSQPRPGRNPKAGGHGGPGDTFVPNSGPDASPSPDDHPFEHGHIASNDAMEEGRGHRRSGRKWPKPAFQAGRYAAVRPIGGEGMGVIYIGYDRDEIGRVVAIKTVENENHGKRLRLEGEIHGQLEHPNILPVYGTGVTQQGRPFIALQHIRKGDLRKAIRNFHAGLPILPKNPDDSPYFEMFEAARNERTDEPEQEVPNSAQADTETDPTGHEAGESRSPVRFDKLRGERLSDFNDLLRRFTDICNAIDYAHDRGVLHRDLKPGNVMLGNHGETFVIDWGIAKLLDESRSGDDSDQADQVIVSAEVDATRRDMSPGTPLYMAPEQLAGENHKVDRRTDTFALGLILCEILTGMQPFFARIQAKYDKLPNNEKSYHIKPMLLGSIRQGPPDLVGSNRSIPRPLAAICRKALAFDQADRYQTARELADEVNRWLADEPVKAYRGEEGRIEKTARWARRNRGKAAALVASLIFVTFGVIVVATLLQILANQRFESQRQEALAAQRALLDERTIASTKAEKRYADSQAAHKLAMSRGAWIEAIRIIDDLENQIADSNLPISPGELVDLKLDRLDALDGASRTDESRDLAKSIDQELKSRPERFDSRRRARLYLRMGDLFREDLQPGETSAFDLALKERLTESERKYVIAQTEPDPVKAISLLEESLQDDPYNLRAIVMVTTLKHLTGNAESGRERLRLARSIMPEDEVLLLFATTLDVILEKTMPIEADRQRILAAFGHEIGQAILDLWQGLCNSDSPEIKSTIRMYASLKSIRDAPVGNRLAHWLNAFTVNPPAALVPFGEVVANQLSEPLIAFDFEGPGKALLEMTVLRNLRRDFKVPLKNHAERVADYREALNRYPIAEIAMMLAIEQQMAGDLAGIAEAVGQMSTFDDAFRDRWTLMKTAMLMVVTELDEEAFAWFGRGHHPFGPAGIVTEPMRKSLRMLLRSMLNENRTFDVIEIELISQLASFIDDHELAALILSNQSLIEPDNTKKAFLVLHRANIEPMAMIDYLLRPSGRLRGDLWTALRIRIHRDFPALARSVPELNGMPENPFQPASVDHPTPFRFDWYDRNGPIMRSP